MIFYPVYQIETKDGPRYFASWERVTPYRHQRGGIVAEGTLGEVQEALLRKGAASCKKYPGKEPHWIETWW